MELCGGASYRLSPIELDTWLYRFDSFYPVNVVNVHGIAGKESEAWWHDFLSEIGAKIAKKMTIGDALILREAENYDPEAIITWNSKDFSVALSVLTPTAYLQRR